MARMHTRKKGSSGSRPPFRDAPPEWCDVSEEELEKHIMRLHDSGMSTSMIGLVLRDQYGVPSSKLILGKRITRLLSEKGEVQDIPEDLTNLMRKAIRVRKHMRNNHKDVHNKRSLHLTESKIRRLAKYYRRTGKLPVDWRYKPETAEMLVT